MAASLLAACLPAIHLGCCWQVWVAMSSLHQLAPVAGKTHTSITPAGLWSTLVQVMAWCRQATSHYLSQCWPKSLWYQNSSLPCLSLSQSPWSIPQSHPSWQLLAGVGGNEQLTSTGTSGWQDTHIYYMGQVQSTLVQVMAWCCQAPSHYLNQCWPRSV